MCVTDRRHYSAGGILVNGEINAAALDTMFDQFDSDGGGGLVVQ